jgi:hypothetical protein
MPEAPRLIRETVESEWTRAGWLVFEIPESWEAEAREWRNRRDIQFSDRDVYDRADTDERWVGELGEMVFDWWLRSEGITDAEWIKDNPSGEPDFIVAGWRIGVKTVKRQVSFKKEYCGQISERHMTAEPSDAYFFMSYQMTCWNPRTRQGDPCRLMWLVGGCSAARFRRHAVLTRGPATDPCNPNYSIREGHAVYNCRENFFTPPREFLAYIRSHPPEAAE